MKTEELKTVVDKVNCPKGAREGGLGHKLVRGRMAALREAWGECTYCSGIPHMEGVELQPCASGYIGCEVDFGKCPDDKKVGMVVYYRNEAGGYVDFDFCPFCGKPQTEKAWAELEKRMRW